ncbi:MAG: hypothetical protein H0X63_11380 [Flavobacteriales bacterium]|nr:hypothetical protein [Flavobacteriales bacterium]
MINKCINIFSFIFYFVLIVSCKNENQKNQQINEGKYNITLLNDSIRLNEHLKAIAYIETPFFIDKNVRLIVYLENDENDPLKKDLSNERDIPFDLFISLDQDEYNQKWFKDYHFETSVVFGKKFSTPGEKTLRGYFLEYYGGNYDPKNDIVLEDGKMEKKYFEKTIYIKDTIN